MAAALAGTSAPTPAIGGGARPPPTNEYGFGDAATVPPRGGTLFESRNLAPVVAALRGALGPEALLQSLTVQPDSALAIARAGDRLVYVDVDASARTRVRDGGRADPAGLIPLARIDASVVDEIVAAAERETGAPVEDLSIQDSWEWSVHMEHGEPDRYVANFDGSGLRLPGEPNPEPVGAAPHSLLRADNLGRVLESARDEAGPGARIADMDIRPDDVSFTLELPNGRILALDYGFGAVLTRRDLVPTRGADTGSVAFEDVEADLVERVARDAGKELADVQYVLLQLSFDAPPALSLYLPEGSDPPYVQAPLRG
jgi:hypothetical protein